MPCLKAAAEEGGEEEEEEEEVGTSSLRPGRGWGST
jgi:hypothetical protein